MEKRKTFGVLNKVLLRVITAVLLLHTATPLRAQEVLDSDPNTLAPSKDPRRTANGLAQQPPMGWNSWNKFACKVDETTIRATADAIATNGMKGAGYNYVVIDD